MPNSASLARSNDINDKLSIQAIYQRGEYLSLKVDAYFQVYELLFRPFVGKPLTFVEIGVLNGGSLFMWREYFGAGARIIGVDLNPAAKKWEQHGFEIHIGSQSDPYFWRQFYAEVGPVDVILDDGGHTNTQQIVTTVSAFDHVRDGGLILVEDTHTSYFADFGNPSRYSFVSFAKHVADAVNTRFPRVRVAPSRYGTSVYSVQFFQSMVVFHIDRPRCVAGQSVRNQGSTSSAQDFRYRGTSRERVQYAKERAAAALPQFAGFVRTLFYWPERLLAWIENRKLRPYFK